MSQILRSKATTLFIFIFVLVGQQLAAGALAQANGDDFIATSLTVHYNNLKLRLVEDSRSGKTEPSSPEDLRQVPLTIVEENLAHNLNSHWAWPEYTLDMIDSYSPFLFRTKKSREIEEVKVLLKVSATGKVEGYELQSEVDKGLRERIDYLVRKLPDCKPVPGFQEYSAEVFELTIQK